jgi:WD40 repeat protein
MRPLETWPAARRSTPILRDRRLVTFNFDEGPSETAAAIVRERSIDGGPERTLGRWRPRGLSDWTVDPTGATVVSVQSGALLEQPLDALSATPRILGRHEGEVRLWIGGDDRLMTTEKAGEVRLWKRAGGRAHRTLRSPVGAGYAVLDAAGRFVASAPGGGPLPPRSFVLFDLSAPRSAEGTSLLADRFWLNDMMFDPGGNWLASAHDGTLVLWNLRARRSTVLREKGPLITVAFTRDGRLVSSSFEEGVVRLWPLAADDERPVRTLFSEKGARLSVIGLERHGRFATVARRFMGQVLHIPLDGSPVRTYSLTRGRGEPAVEMPRVDPGGQRVAVLYLEWGNPDAGSIRVLDPATGSERVLRSDTAGTCPQDLKAYGQAVPFDWLPDGRLVSDGTTGLRVWDLATGASRQIRPCVPPLGDADEMFIRSTPDGRQIVRLAMMGSVAADQSSLLSVVNLESAASRDISSHGSRVHIFDLDPTGATLVTGSNDGLVRAGPLTGEEPHLLYGHTRRVTGVAVSPDRKWIASAGDDDTIRLWPVPEGPPLHTLPHDVLLAKLRALTNLRVVPAPASATGYRIQADPFPGWATVPTW